MSYLGITHTNFFSSPAVYISKLAGVTDVVDYHGNKVTYSYNSYGYRTREFNQIPKTHILSVGCSMSEGQGIPISDTWATQLENKLGIPVFNLAKKGSNAEFCFQNIKNWTKNNTPNIVIAQWPNPYRMMCWSDSGADLITSAGPTIVFDAILKHAESTFLVNWTNSILTANRICKDNKIRIINIYFEPWNDLPEFVKETLKQNNIIMELDLKTQDASWHFDRGAFDKVHHSGKCNKQWAERISSIINQH